MGRPCDCFCGGSTGGGGGGLPPGGQEPITSSGNGPFKVYAGTVAVATLPSGQDEGDNYWSNGSQYQLKDSFIYGFTERPTIRAFNDTFIYMADIYDEIVALFSPDHPDDAFSNEAGGRLPRSSGDYKIFDLKAAIQSAFTEEERSYGLGKFLGIGSQHIQLAGGHVHQGYVRQSGEVLIIEKDGWDPYQAGQRDTESKEFGYGLVFLAAVDGRSFFGSGGKIYSCGDNFSGRLGRGGGFVDGAIAPDWTPSEIDDVSDCPACDYEYDSIYFSPSNQIPPGSGDDWGEVIKNEIPKLWLSPNAGALSMIHPTDPSNSFDGEPNNFAVAFGDVGKVGYKHTNYDPELSQPPTHVPSQSPFKFQACLYDSWESTAFFGSKMLDGGTAPYDGVASQTHVGGPEMHGIRGPLGASFYGFGFETKHEQPSEAFPFIENGINFTTGGHICVNKSGRYCGEIPEGWAPAKSWLVDSGPQVILAQNYGIASGDPCAAGDGEGYVYGCGGFDWCESSLDADDCDPEVDRMHLNSIDSYKDIDVGWTKEGYLLKENPIAYSLNAPGVGNHIAHGDGNTVTFSHDQIQFSKYQYIAMTELALTSGVNIYYGNSFSIPPYVWVGGSLQWYGFTFSQGCGGNPEGSGSFCVAMANARCDTPPVGIVTNDINGNNSIYFSGVHGGTQAQTGYQGSGLTTPGLIGGAAGSLYDINSVYLLSAFLPSGLESCTVPIESSKIDKVIDVGADYNQDVFRNIEEAPRPIYCVYYSGDPITRFRNWWARHYVE